MPLEKLSRLSDLPCEKYYHRDAPLSIKTETYPKSLLMTITKFYGNKDCLGNNYPTSIRLVPVGSN